jgi:hypothetical protein
MRRLEQLTGRSLSDPRGIAELSLAFEIDRRDQRPADTLAGRAFRLKLRGCDFEAHQPPELAGYLRTLGVRLTRAAGPLSLQLADRGEAASSQNRDHVQ